MQLPKIYNGELEDGSKVRHVNISPIHQQDLFREGIDKRFRDHANASFASSVKHKGRNPGTRSYYSQNNPEQPVNH